MTKRFLIKRVKTIKGRINFKSKRIAGRVCTLLNNIRDADNEKRFYNFYTKGDCIVFEFEEAKNG